MLALLFIAAVWTGMGLTYYRRVRPARLAGRPFVWGPRAAYVPFPELPPFPVPPYPIIGGATAATGGFDEASYAADVVNPMNDSPFLVRMTPALLDRPRD